MKTKILLSITLPAALLLIILITACPPPITDFMMSQVSDLVIPTITIDSPEDGSSYASTVIVTGKIKDTSSTDGELGGLKSLRYELVPATQPGDEVEFEEDGSFSFQFPTTAYSGTIVINVVVTDWNGNQAQASINLIDAGAIPSFTASTGNHQVTLTWDDVPLADSYSIYYTSNGSLPSQNYGDSLENVTSPVSLSELENGSLHVFQLHAKSSAGEDNWSNYLSAIPLAETTLAPRISARYGEIGLTWHDIEGAEDCGYEVWRSDSRDGEYINISGTIRRAYFTDYNTAEGQQYYYKIKPALEGSNLSAANGGEPCLFPDGGFGFLGRCQSGDARVVYIYEGYAYVGTWDSIKVIDISNLQKPQLVGSCSLTEVHWMEAKGDYLYVADGSAGLKVIDISSPKTVSDSSVVGSCATAAEAMDVAIKGNYAFVAAGSSGLSAVNISNPESVNNGSLENTCDTDDAAAIEIFGDYAFIAESDTFNDNGLKVIDISSVANLHTADTDFCPLGGGINNVKLSSDGNYAFVVAIGGAGSLWVVDISNPAEVNDLSHVATCDLPGDSIYSLSVSGPLVYVTDQFDGVYVVDASDPQNIDNNSMITLYEETLSAQDVVVENMLAFIADAENGFLTFNVTSPYGAAEVTSVPSVTTGGAILLYDDYLFAPNNAVNVSSPEMPGPVVSWPISYAEDLSLTGSTVCVAAGSEIKTVDVSDPVNSSIKSSVTAYANHADILGDYLAVGGGWEATYNFTLVEITDPSDPESISTLPVELQLTGLGLRESSLFITGSSGADDLVAYDVTNPVMPQKINGVNRGSLYGMVVEGDYAYGIDYTGSPDYDYRLTAFDISDPGTIVETAAPCVLSGDFNDICIAGEYAYVAADTGGLDIVDISDKSAPIVVKNIPSSNARAVTVRGRYAYLLDTVDGLKIINLLPDP